MTNPAKDTAAAGSDQAVTDFNNETYARDLDMRGAAYRTAYERQYNELCDLYNLHQH